MSYDDYDDVLHVYRQMGNLRNLSGTFGEDDEVFKKEDPPQSFLFVVYNHVKVTLL